VLRLDNLDGQPIAIVANFATHPVSQGGRMRTVSTDYPGQASAIVTQLTEAPCLFLQGACGNINSIIMQHSHEPPRTLGTRLGCDIVRLWETIDVKPVSSLGVMSRTVSLPRKDWGSESEAGKVATELRRQLEDLREAEEPNQGRIYWAETRLSRVEAALDSWRSGSPLPELPIELQALHLDDFAYVTAPAEVFNQIGSEIKEHSPFSDTFFVGYSNGSIGYIPVAAAYPEGGYEVTHASQVNPQAAGILTEGCLNLLVGLDERRSDA
jgi:neutral ceramidase